MRRRELTTSVIFGSFGIFFVLFFWMFFAFPRSSPSLSSASVREMTIGTTTLRVEIAETSDAHVKGLSGRSKLTDGTGMLFIFDHPDLYGFWMPDMKFPIDIIWFGDDWHIVDIASDVSPDSYPKVFVPKAKAQYVLEAPAGTAHRWGWDEETPASLSE